MVQNRALIYSSVPHGLPIPGKDLTIASNEFDLSAAPPTGGITVKNHYVSYDPFQRGKMRDPSIPSYNAAYNYGEPIHNMGIATVLKSDHPEFKEGDVVKGESNTEEYSILSKEYLDGLSGSLRFSKLENPLGLEWPNFLGALGMSGLTAWSSLYAIGKPKKGESILVSAASGAVGQIVGQLAKKEGMTVIGSVGDDAKLDFIVKELGFDAGG
jgi:NADPH-dependent curcumin reductase CurA